MVRLFIATVFAAALAALVAAPGASALNCGAHTAYSVGTPADESDSGGTGPGPDGLLSLREAVNQANADGTSSDITLPGGTYHLTAGELAVNSDCAFTLTGAGARTTVVDAGGLSRVVNDTNSDGTTISGITITGGTKLNGGGDGGGITTANKLSLDAVTVTGNVAQNDGAGVYVATSRTRRPMLVRRRLAASATPTWPIYIYRRARLSMRIGSTVATSRAPTRRRA